MKYSLNNKDSVVYRVIVHAVALVENGLVWALAVWLVLSDSEWSRAGGWLLLGCKGLMLLTTAVGLLVHPAKALRIFAGRYRFARRPLRGIGQALTRFVWELPQLWTGYLFAQWRNIVGRVERVDTLEGVTFVTGRHWVPRAYAGVSLGCFANMWVSGGIGDDFEQYAQHSPFNIFRHEYGHSVDSQLWGWLYLPLVGLPSLISQALRRPLRQAVFSVRRLPLRAEVTFYSARDYAIFRHLSSLFR